MDGDNVISHSDIITCVHKKYICDLGKLVPVWEQNNTDIHRWKLKNSLTLEYNYYSICNDAHNHIRNCNQGSCDDYADYHFVIEIDGIQKPYDPPIVIVDELGRKQKKLFEDKRKTVAVNDLTNIGLVIDHFRVDINSK